MKAKSKKNDKESRKEIDDLRNQLVRALADYDNLRKRVEKERDEFAKLTSIRFVLKLLPILDMLEAAQKDLASSGISIIIKEFTDLLEGERIEKIKVNKGDLFNENYHEVIDTVGKKAGKKGEIVKVNLTGWKYRDDEDFVIRPAKVTVIK